MQCKVAPLWKIHKMLMEVDQSTIWSKKKKNIPVRKKAIMGLNLWACLCMCNLKKRLETVTFSSMCVFVLNYYLAYCPVTPILLTQRSFARSFIIYVRIPRVVAAWIILWDLQNKVKWWIGCGRELDTSVSVKSCMLTSCGGGGWNPSLGFTWHLVAGCGLDSSTAVVPANAMLVKNWVIFSRKSRFRLRFMLPL